jgi:hypothetical protein
VGIKFGMTVKDAMLALKADNPRLNLAPETLQLKGFADQLMSSVTCNEMITSGPNSSIARAGEKVTIGFTLPPSQELVWAIKRDYDFATAERPPLQVTLDALLKKYGPETQRINPGPNTNHLTWVYDTTGKPLGARGAQLNTTCTDRILSSFQNGTQDDIQGTGRRWPPECSSVIIARASVSAQQEPGSSQYVVSHLTVTLADGARYWPTIEATRAVALNAAKAHEKKQTDEVNKRAAPKL